MIASKFSVSILRSANREPSQTLQGVWQSTHPGFSGAESADATFSDDMDCCGSTGFDEASSDDGRGGNGGGVSVTSSTQLESWEVAIRRMCSLRGSSTKFDSCLYLL